MADDYASAWKGDKPEGNKMSPVGLVLTLFNARTAAHVMHLVTRSYAAHKALNEFYDGIVDVADRFAEAWQGANGLLPFPATAAPTALDGEPLAMLAALRRDVVACRAGYAPHLQQILDDGIELIDSTAYKLRFLK